MQIVESDRFFSHNNWRCDDSHFQSMMMVAMMLWDWNVSTWFLETLWAVRKIWMNFRVIETQQFAISYATKQLWDENGIKYQISLWKTLTWHHRSTLFADYSTPWCSRFGYMWASRSIRFLVAYRFSHSTSTFHSPCWCSAELMEKFPFWRFIIRVSILTNVSLLRPRAIRVWKGRVGRGWRGFGVAVALCVDVDWRWRTKCVHMAKWATQQRRLGCYFAVKSSGNVCCKYTSATQVMQI